MYCLMSIQSIYQENYSIGNIVKIAIQTTRKTTAANIPEQQHTIPFCQCAEHEHFQFSTSHRIRFQKLLHSYKSWEQPVPR